MTDFRPIDPTSLHKILTKVLTEIGESLANSVPEKEMLLSKIGYFGC